MNGPVIVLLTVLTVTPIVILAGRLDSWLDRRAFERRYAEAHRYQLARAAVARDTYPTQLGRKHHD